MSTTGLSLIAERYTSALFALADKARALDAVEKDFAALSQMLAASPELSRMLSNPLLPRAAKASAMDALLAKTKAHDLTRRFIRHLALASRLPALSAILARFESLLVESRGEQVAEVTSARPLSSSEQQDISRSLEKALSRKVRLRTRVNSALIGGLTVNIGGRMIDDSIATKLARLARQLKTA